MDMHVITLLAKCFYWTVKSPSRKLLNFFVAFVIAVISFSTATHFNGFAAYSLSTTVRQDLSTLLYMCFYGHLLPFVML